MVCCWVFGLFFMVCIEGVLGLIFWVLEVVFLCFLWVFFGYFQRAFGGFFCADFLVFWLGLCDCSVVFSGFFCWVFM